MDEDALVLGQELKMTSIEISTTIITIDSGPLSSAESTSPAEKPEYENPEDDPDYVSPKWAKLPPKIWKPYLQHFTLFSDLPVECQNAIWKLTLSPRVVEIKFAEGRGFYPPTKIPVALRVSKASREVVKKLYPLCFGNLLYEPKTPFNFSLDTIYLGGVISHIVSLFLISLRENELNHIQCIAVDCDIDNYFRYGEHVLIDLVPMEALQKASKIMPALKEVTVITKLNDCYHEHGFPEGQGTIELMESFTHELQQYMYHKCYHSDEEGEDDCQDLPDPEEWLNGFDSPKRTSMFGWRTTDLPLPQFPW